MHSENCQIEDSFCRLKLESFFLGSFKLLIKINGKLLSQKLLSEDTKWKLPFSTEALDLTSFFFSTGYSASALLAIIFAIPFGIRLLFHHDGGRWQHFSEAFYSTYFELFLGNACLGKPQLHWLRSTKEEDRKERGSRRKLRCVMPHE